MYIVLEIQKNINGQISTIPTSFISRNEAESKYHTILSFAAISEVPVHSAIIMTEEGQPIMYQSYSHEVNEEDNNIEE